MSIKESLSGINLNIPLVPIHIEEAFEALPRGKPLPRFSKIKITFGKPFSSEKLKETAKDLEIKNDYEAIVTGLKKEMIDLIPKNGL